MTMDTHKRSILMNTRGLCGDMAGCALNVLLVANAVSGRSKLCTKQSALVGLGNAFMSATASSMVRGEPVLPAGARQRLGSTALLALAPATGAAPAAVLATLLPPSAATGIAGASAPGSAPQASAKVTSRRAAVARAGELGKTNILRVSPRFGATSARGTRYGTPAGCSARRVLSGACGVT